MTIPTSMMSAGIAKTLRETYDELKSRLDNQGARFFDGTPDPDNIPDDPYQIWLAPGAFDGNDNGSPKSFNQTSVWTQWSIVILRVNVSTHEPYSVNMYESFEDLDKFINAVASTVSDMTLTGKVEWVDEPRGQILLPPPSAVGNRRIVGAEFEIGVHHGPDPTRCQT